MTTSFIAGRRHLAADLLAEPSLQTFEVSPDTGFDQRADDINPFVD